MFFPSDLSADCRSNLTGCRVHEGVHLLASCSTLNHYCFKYSNKNEYFFPSDLSADCRSNLTGCRVHALCESGPGGVQCRCNRGYFLHDLTCVRKYDMKYDM